MKSCNRRRSSDLFGEKYRWKGCRLILVETPICLIRDVILMLNEGCYSKKEVEGNVARVRDKDKRTWIEE